MDLQGMYKFYQARVDVDGNIYLGVLKSSLDEEALFIKM